MGWLVVFTSYQPLLGIQCQIQYIQYITKVSTPLTLQIFKYISLWDKLTKWHFDTMKSSLCAAYITEFIYFPLKITQNIIIKS